MKKRGDGRQSIESFEIAFREIEEITSESDMDVLVERFIQGILPLLLSLNEEVFEKSCCVNTQNR